MSKKNPEKANEKVIELKKEDPKNGQPASVKEARIVPVRVSDLDRMGILLAGEKVKRLQAELQAVSLKLTSIDADLKKCGEEERSALRDIWMKYQLGPEDTFDSTSGMITRKAPPNQPQSNHPTPSQDGSLST